MREAIAMDESAYVPAQVLALLLEMEEHWADLCHAAAREVQDRRTTTCLGCGCLVSPDEVCPGCRARRQRLRDLEREAAVV